MYPNPQEALPLPRRPSLEQYKKLAKELVKACRSGNAAAVRAWTTRWVASLVALQPESERLRHPAEMTAAVDRLEEFARKQLSGRGQRASGCALADAQFVIARAHGFTSWPTFLRHVESLTGRSFVSAFESAVDAIVAGDAATLSALLIEHPDLVRAHSTREHGATLLHYVSANGVEGYRQVSPRNIAEIAKILLDAGAEVDAPANVYGSDKCTTLGLVATSSPPADAGVQLDLIELLLQHGARTDVAGIAGRGTLVRSCLANGQPEAAEYLANRGTPLDLVEAAGLGRVEVLARAFDDDVAIDARRAQAIEAFAYASAYGRRSAVEFLLDHGVDVDAELRLHGEGHSGLHVAAYYAHLAVVDLLLARGARVAAIDKTWGTPPLVWALTGWSTAPPARAERYYAVVARLVAAGADVRPDLLERDKVRADAKMRAALTGFDS